MKIFKHEGEGLSKGRRRAGVAIAVSIASVVACLVGAAPAQADNPKGFTIYYSPNCTGASRNYPGLNSGEDWINDTFNAPSIYTAGYGQHIRFNAASIQINYGTTVQISFNESRGGIPYIEYATFVGTGFCQNFNGYQRNTNYHWATY